MRRLFPLLVLVLAAAPVCARCTATLISGPVKVRPYGTAVEPLSAPLVCARNEYCSFQVVITAEGDGCRVSEVSVAGFARGEQRLPDSNVTIYREDFLPVFYRSSEQGDLGEWPDPLIPKVDPEYGESRNAFPVDVGLISRAYRKHPARRGRTVAGPRGQGFVISGGQFRSTLVQRFEVRIARGGRTGDATFRWRSEPGTLTWSDDLPTSVSPVQLENGVTVSFTGAGGSDDFVAGEEFWIFSGPRRRQAVWVDVLIPADAAAGQYTGQATVMLGNGTQIALPVEIEVLNVALPVTSSLPNSFGLYAPGIFRAHFPEPLNQDQMQEIAQAYARAALRNGITVGLDAGFEPRYEFTSDGKLLQADYSRYDAALGPFLDGAGTPRGARWTSLPVPAFQQFNGEQFNLVVRDFVRHARERGWADRLYVLVFDEPSTPDDFAQVTERARRWREAAPELPRIVTTVFNESLVGLVNVWAPPINLLEVRSLSPREWWRNRRIPELEAYRERVAAGDRLWSYQSCLSHACGGTGRSPETDNWPSYMVDISALANRVFGLLAVHYKMNGFLYWDAAYAHHYNPGAGNERVDPWESLYYFGGNGDGSLFYPGRPEEIGGTHPIAIESLRLKMIRDSLVDADYAAMLKQAGDEEFLDSELARLIKNAYRWNSDPRAWVEFRARLARRIVELALGASGHQ